MKDHWPLTNTFLSDETTTTSGKMHVIKRVPGLGNETGIQNNFIHTL